MREGSFTCFGWSQVVVWGSVYCFCEGTLPVTCWAGDLYSLGCPLFLRAESIALSLSSLFNCSYKWTPLTLVFSYRFSRWMLISRLVNTLESDSKRHAVRSALPAVLPGPGLDLLFVLIEFICLPLALASLFFVCGLERRALNKQQGFSICSALCYWPGAAVPYAWSLCFLFVGADGGLFAWLCVEGQATVGFTVHFDAMRPSPSSSKEHLFSKAKTNILLPGSLWYHMLCLWPDPVLCGSWDGTLDGQHTVIKEV